MYTCIYILKQRESLHADGSETEPWGNTCISCVVAQENVKHSVLYTFIWTDLHKQCWIIDSFLFCYFLQTHEKRSKFYAFSNFLAFSAGAPRFPEGQTEIRVKQPSTSLCSFTVINSLKAAVLNHKCVVWTQTKHFPTVSNSLCLKSAHISIRKLKVGGQQAPKGVKLLWGRCEFTVLCWTQSRIVESAHRNSIHILNLYWSSACVKKRRTSTLTPPFHPSAAPWTALDFCFYTQDWLRTVTAYVEFRQREFIQERLEMSMKAHSSMP